MSERDDRNNTVNPVGKAFVFTVHPEKLPASSEFSYPGWELKGNSVGERVDAYRRYVESLAILRYAVLALEEGEKEGKQHLQGYFVQKASSARASTIRACLLLGLSGSESPGWVEIRRGTHVEARDYCKHEGKHVNKKGALLGLWEMGSEAGLSSTDRSASEYSLLIADMEEGKSDSELLRAYPWLYLRYYHNISKIRAEFFGSASTRLVMQKIKEGFDDAC